MRRAGTGPVATVGALIVLGACAETAEAPPQRIEGPEGLLAVDGAQLHYRTVGSGEPVVVIHGGPGMEHSYLLPGLPDVIPGRTLVFYDQRGTGRSLGEVDSTSVSLDRFLEDIDAVREALGVDAVDLVAHSFGSFLALRFAHARPERVRRLVLLSPVEPGFRYAEESQARRVERRRLEDEREMDSLTTSDAFRMRDRATVNRVYALAFRPSFANPDSAARLALDFTARTAQNGGRVAQALMGPLGRYDDYGRLPEIAVSTLIVHGAEDLLPVAAAEEMAAGMPSARLVVVEGAGHFPWIERREATRAAILEFLGDS